MYSAKKYVSGLTKKLYYSLIFLFILLFFLIIPPVVFGVVSFGGSKKHDTNSSYKASYKFVLSAPEVEEYKFTDYTGEFLSNRDYDFLEQVSRTDRYYAVYVNKKINLYEQGTKKKVVIDIPPSDFSLLPEFYLKFDVDIAKLGVFELPQDKLLIDVGYFSGGKPPIGLLYIYDIRSGNLSNICGDEICLSATDVIIINNEEFFVVNSSSDGCGGITTFELYNLNGEKRGISKDYDVGCWLADSNAYLGSIDGKAIFLKEDLTQGPDKNTRYTGLWSVDLLTGEGKELLSGNLSDSISWGTRLIGGTSVLRVYHRETSGSDLFYFDLDSGEYISDPDVIKKLEVFDTSLYAYVDKDIKTDVFSERYGEVVSVEENSKDYIIPQYAKFGISDSNLVCWGSLDISYGKLPIQLWYVSKVGSLSICIDSIATQMGFKVIGVGSGFATVEDPKTNVAYRVELRSYPNSRNFEEPYPGFILSFSSLESNNVVQYRGFLDTKDWFLWVEKER